LLLPEEQAAEIWPADGTPQRLERACRLEGGSLFPGLVLELAEIWSG
jgi:hypothetical protein